MPRYNSKGTQSAFPKQGDVHTESFRPIPKGAVVISQNDPYPSEFNSQTSIQSEGKLPDAINLPQAVVLPLV
jgi:hypothetical protein